VASDDFGALMRSADPALLVVTAADERERAGCLIGFHSQSSIAPARYCVWLSKANYTYRVALRGEHLGLHFLTAADRALAERFGTLTGDTADKFAGLVVSAGPGGVPLLGACPHWLVTRRTALLDEGGDHVCVVGEPVAGHTGPDFAPLRQSAVGHLHPGHGAAERPGPPSERAAPEDRGGR
jgi:flavin reductase (DIM6/NTAB) family NADH-FMN oxidoreductase RutF